MNPLSSLFAIGFGAILVYLAIIILMIASMWTLYQKAGKPGWAVLIPIYNTIVMLEIVKKPIWWLAMMFIPLVNIVFGIMIIIELAKAYGKDAGYAVGMILLPIIFYPMLAFSKDTKYVYAENESAMNN